MTTDSITAMLLGFAERARSSIADEVEIRAQRAARQAALFGAAGAFVAIALGFAGFAGYTALAPLWGPPLAALAVAGGALALAGLCVLVALRASATPEQDANPTPAGTETDAVAAEIAGIVERLQNEAARNGESLVVGSLAAGIALAMLRDRR